MTITTQRLRHVVALSKHQNFARAARALNITQPALSKSISALESSLGARLFDRNTKGVELTVFGVAVTQRATDILQSVKDMEREIDLLQGREIGAVTIGAGPIVAASHIGRAIGRMTLAHPKLKVKLQVDNWNSLSKTLQTGDIELFVGESAQAFASQSLVVTPLRPRRVVFFARANHPLTKHTTLALSDLQSYPLASPSLPPRVEHMLRSGSTAIDWWGDYPQVPPAIECESYPVLKSVVAASDAISGAPVSIIEDELRSGVLVMLNVDMPELNTQFGIVHSAKRKLSPGAESFIRHLLKEDIERDRSIGPLTQNKDK